MSGGGSLESGVGGGHVLQEKVQYDNRQVPPKSALLGMRAIANNLSLSKITVRLKVYYPCPGAEIGPTGARVNKLKPSRSHSGNSSNGFDAGLQLAAALCRDLICLNLAKRPNNNEAGWP